MRTIIIIACFCIPLFGFGQRMFGANSQPPAGVLDASIRYTKTGPYLGLQQGKYMVLELGAERQWVKIQLWKAPTHAMNMGFNYNFRRRVLGYDVGYWYRKGRVGMTYGVKAFMRTDFETTKMGVAPVIGWQFWWLHLQTGYHFMSRPKDLQTNTFFVSLRFGLINDRDLELRRLKKP